APHGGFLILTLVNKPFLWVGCILTGSCVGAVLYALVTPKAIEHDDATAINPPQTIQTFYKVDTVNLNLTAK
ncbi:MAG TPA: PTS fructose transporter subunit IIABC, partial [Pasteurellaceae bacterium]|nr:PTS fructose transporter subunit IIABC [Pasteurellaceae bacterium]